MFLESIASEEMNVIDVGGHIGVTTAAIAKKVGKRGRVYSFEPASEYFDILKKNLSANKLENTEAINLVLLQDILWQVGKIDFSKAASYDGESLNRWSCGTIIRIGGGCHRLAY